MRILEPGKSWRIRRIPGKFKIAVGKPENGKNSADIKNSENSQKSSAWLGIHKAVTNRKMR